MGRCVLLPLKEWIGGEAEKEDIDAQRYRNREGSSPVRRHGIVTSYPSVDCERRVLASKIRSSGLKLADDLASVFYTFTAQLMPDQ